MLTQQEMYEIITKIVSENNLGEISSIKPLNMGFNRVAYNVNDKYVIKICINPKKDAGVISEINFYSQDTNSFHPKLIASDSSKFSIPYIYTIEEKVNGHNMFDIWSTLNIHEKEAALNQLITILKTIHTPVPSTKELTKSIPEEYDKYLTKLAGTDILSKENMMYLKLLQESIPEYFRDASFGHIHGDVHFNNIVYTQDGLLKLIDFECYGITALDKEFDPIHRMVRNPNSLIKTEFQASVNKEEYPMIMDYLIRNYPEVCGKPNFDERLLIYDCINSLKWLYYYPTYQPYHEILFDQSKKLLKR